MPAFEFDVFDDAFDVSPASPIIIINALDKTTSVKLAEGVDFNYILGSRARMSCRTVDLALDTAGAYAADIDQSIELSFEGVDLFSGVIQDAIVGSLGDLGRGTVGAVDAVDYSYVFDVVLVTHTFAAGQTLKQIFQWFATNKLAPYGITLDPAMASGPSFATSITFDNVTLTTAFNELMVASVAWAYRLRPDKVLSVFEVGTSSSSIALSTSNIASIEYRKTRQQYFNRIVAEYGGQQNVNEHFVGNGSATSWALKYPSVVNTDGMIVSAGYVTVDDGTNPVNFDIGKHGTETAPFTWDSSGNILRTVLSIASGTTIDFNHATEITLKVTVEDATQVALRGPHELKVRYWNTFDIEYVTSQATALLEKYLLVAREVRLVTRAGMIWPGMTVPVTIPERNISGDWLVVEARGHSESNTSLVYEYTLLEGTTAQPTWVDYFKALFSGGSSGGQLVPAGVSGSTTLIPSGIFTGDVIANSGLTGKEVRISEFTTGISGGRGSGVQFGRGSSTDEATWKIHRTSNGTYGSDRGRLNITYDKDSTLGAALAIHRESAGKYIVLGHTHFGTGTSADTGIALGDVHGVLGLPGTQSRLIGYRGFTTKCDDGIFEFGRSVRSGHYQPWTPIWSSVSNPQPSLGNGSLTGWYAYVCGKNVRFELYLKAGSTTTFGEGAWLFTLPVAGHAEYGGVERWPIAFMGTARDNSTGHHLVKADFGTASTIRVWSHSASGAGVLIAGSLGVASVPFTWGQDDRLFLSGEYEAASAV